MGNKSSFEESLFFRTINQKGLSFEDVFRQIISFMKQEPTAKYRFMIGTDSQRHGRHTVFATVIVIYREGKGAWVCRRKIRHPRKYENLYEKISMETSLTEQIAFLFTEEHRREMVDIVLPYIYKGSSLSLEGHIDIGSEPQNKTRIFIKEMESRIKSCGLEPKIKPYSIAASGVANKSDRSHVVL